MKSPISSETQAGPVGTTAARSSLNRARIADQIVTDLQERIARGEFQRGARLPTERDLAQSYAVSSPTIREALRVLSSSGLIEVRRGSGAYVAQSSRTILDAPLSLLVGWEKVGIEELMGLLRVLNLYAAEMAIENATAEEKKSLVAAAEATAVFTTVDDQLAKFDRFLTAFVACTHQPLLDALCSFLTRVLVRLELRYHPSRSKKYWRQWAADSASMRLEVAQALEQGDRDLLVTKVDDFHTMIRDRLLSLPGIQEAHVM